MSVSDLSMDAEEVARNVRNAGLSDEPTGVPEVDDFCFKCHKSIQKREDRYQCPGKCSRSFHKNCTSPGKAFDPEWKCFYCQDIIRYEKFKPTLVSSELWRISGLSSSQLNELLSFTLTYLKQADGIDPFCRPVDPRLYPTYYSVVFRPMCLLNMEEKAKNEAYTSTAEFRSDISWVMHNCIVFNGNDHVLSRSVKALFHSAKIQTQELETCPECYRHAVTKTKNWFTSVCHPPHPLVWARLTGYPYWPAKVLGYSLNEKNSSATCGQALPPNSKREMKVNVHFFGDHTKQKLAPSEMFFLTAQPPLDNAKSRERLGDSLVELESHIEKIKTEFGCFHYYPSNFVFSLQPMLQLWMVNPPPDDVIQKARKLNSKPLAFQINMLSDSSLSEGSMAVVPRSTPTPIAEHADQMPETNAPNSSSDTETKAEKRQKLGKKLLRMGDKITEAFSKPVCGELPEKLLKYNLLDNTDRRHPIKDIPIDVPLETALKPTAGSETRSAVNFEEVFSQAVDSFVKKQELQLSLSLRTAFAIFRQEASQDLPDANLAMFLKACDALQVKCESSVTSAFHQVSTSCIQRCAVAARSLSIPVAAPSDESLLQTSKVSSSNDRLVELERAEFMNRLIEEMVNDNERQVLEAKTKHWCTNCKKEASLHCCRYASYCSYECQTKHWSTHRPECCQMNHSTRSVQH